MCTNASKNRTFHECMPVNAICCKAFCIKALEGAHCALQHCGVNQQRLESILVPPCKLVSGLQQKPPNAISRAVLPCKAWIGLHRVLLACAQEPADRTASVTAGWRLLDPTRFASTVADQQDCFAACVVLGCAVSVAIVSLVASL